MARVVTIPIGPIFTSGPCRGIIHVIEKGDTLYKLGQRYHVSVSRIMYANPYVNIYNLQIGDELCIPVGQEPRAGETMGQTEFGSLPIGQEMSQRESEEQNMAANRNRSGEMTGRQSMPMEEEMGANRNRSGEMTSDRDMPESWNMPEDMEMPTSRTVLGSREMAADQNMSMEEERTVSRNMSVEIKHPESRSMSDGMEQQESRKMSGEPGMAVNRDMSADNRMSDPWSRPEDTRMPGEGSDNNSNMPDFMTHPPMEGMFEKGYGTGCRGRSKEQCKSHYPVS